MQYRILSHKHKLYTNDPAWPSNQRAASEFVAAPEGDIVEIIHFGEDQTIILDHDKRNFTVEPWTGLKDFNGKNIYLGDILADVNNNKEKVAWEGDGFALKAENRQSLNYLRNSLETKCWTISGNIHGCNFE